MTLKEALNIFGLKENCTEEDLKKAYRTLAKVYHPDNYQDETKKVEAGKKMQILNEANKVVKEHLKTKDSKKTFKYINDEELEKVKTLKAKYLQEALLEIDYIASITDNDIIFSIFYTRFRELIENNFYKNITKKNSIATLEGLYQNYRKEYFELITHYLYKHWEINRITSFVNNDLNVTRETSLKEVRTNMLKIFNTLLNEELDKYRTIKDYSILEPLLTAIRQTHALTCLWGQYNINTTKKELRKHLMFTINGYYKRKKLLDELIGSEVDKDIIDSLQQNVLSEKEFYAIYNKINKPSKAKTLGKRIIKYFKQKNG